MSSYIRLYKTDNFQLNIQTYDNLEAARRDKMVRGGHIVPEIGVVDEV